MSYKTPPTLDSNLKQDLDALVSVIVANVDDIIKAMTTKALSNAGVVTPIINLSAIIKLVDNIILPTVNKWEGSWIDHPSDSNGVAMRGVTLETFISTFDSVLIGTGIPSVQTAANNLNLKKAGWKNNKQVSKQVLYTLCSNERVAALWYYKFLSDENCRYPIAIMTQDPFLGFFLGDCCWGSGAGMYTPNGFDSVAQSYGWNGNVNQFADWCIKLGNKSPEVAVKFIQKRLSYLLDITKSGSSNESYRQGWLARLVNDPKDSQIAMMIRINELFCLNAKGSFQLSQNELQHLKGKAETYKTFSIEVPG